MKSLDMVNLQERNTAVIEIKSKQEIFHFFIWAHVLLERQSSGHITRVGVSLLFVLLKSFCIQRKFSQFKKTLHSTD